MNIWRKTEHQKKLSLHVCVFQKVEAITTDKCERECTELSTVCCVFVCQIQIFLHIDASHPLGNIQLGYCRVCMGWRQ